MTRAFIAPVFVALCTLVPAGSRGGQATPALSSAEIEEISRLVQAKMTKDKIPGLSIAIVKDGAPVWSNGYGLADLEGQVPARPDTRYRSASIGKPMTAVAVMQLAEAKKLDLDAPVQRYCPEFPAKPWPVTARLLLAHLGGVRHYGDPEDDDEIHNTRHYASVRESLEAFKDDALVAEPGTTYSYSTFGYVLLGGVIEGASGVPYLTYMKEHVFRPAGMDHTDADDPDEIVPHRAAGYVLDERRELHNSRYADMSNRLPAGGFLTTVEDLARFAAAFLTDRLVSAATREQMLTPQRTKTGQIVAYGLGWGLVPGETWYGEPEALHGGGSPKVSGMIYLLPRRRFAVAFLTNLESVPERYAFAAEVARIALHLDAAK